MPEPPKPKRVKQDRTGEPYCGVGPIPHGMKRGTAKQCVDLKQVRYYGLEQFDPFLLNKGNMETFDEVNNKIFKLNLRIDKLLKENRLLNAQISINNKELAEDIPEGKRKRLLKQNEKYAKEKQLQFARGARYRKQLHDLHRKRDSIEKRDKRVNESKANLLSLDKKQKSLKKQGKDTKYIDMMIYAANNIAKNEKILDDAFKVVEQMNKKKVIKQKQKPSKKVKKVPKIMKRDCSKLKVPWRRKVCEYNQKKEFRNLTLKEVETMLRFTNKLHN